MKICTICQTEKSNLDFYALKSGKDGLMSECKICNRARAARWGKKNPACGANWRKRNPDYNRQWRKRNSKHLADYASARTKSDTQFRLTRNLRSRLNQAIRSETRAGSAVRDLGMSIADFKQYLESKFQPGMTWENWGSGRGKWNIDHIKPLAKFNLSDREQFLEVCHYTNLQPLWAEENRRKG